MPFELVRKRLAAGHTLDDLRGFSAAQAAERLKGTAE